MASILPVAFKKGCCSWSFWLDHWPLSIAAVSWALSSEAVRAGEGVVHELDVGVGGWPYWAIGLLSPMSYTYPRLGITVTSNYSDLSLRRGVPGTAAEPPEKVRAQEWGGKDIHTSPEDKTLLPLTITQLLLRQCLEGGGTWGRG